MGNLFSGGGQSVDQTVNKLHRLISQRKSSDEILRMYQRSPLAFKDPSILLLIITKNNTQLLEIFKGVTYDLEYTPALTEAISSLLKKDFGKARLLLRHFPFLEKTLSPYIIKHCPSSTISEILKPNSENLKLLLEHAPTTFDYSHWSRNIKDRVEVILDHYSQKYQELPQKSASMKKARKLSQLASMRLKEVSTGQELKGLLSKEITVFKLLLLHEMRWQKQIKLGILINQMFEEALRDSRWLDLKVLLKYQPVVDESILQLLNKRKFKNIREQVLVYSVDDSLQPPAYE